MGEPLKTFFSSTLVRRLAGDITRVHPGFPVRAFTNDACRGVDALELLARGRHIAHALGRHLPPAYPDALEILLGVAGPRACDRRAHRSWHGPILHLLIRTAGAWLEDPSPERQMLVEHALRSAVKRGDPKALRLLGYGQAPRVSLVAVSSFSGCARVIAGDPKNCTCTKFGDMA
jgi:3-methyladenine DNA glycosylase AlkC